MVRLPHPAVRRKRISLFSVLSIGVLMFGIVGMHAGMADSAGHTRLEHTMTTTAVGQDGMVTVATATATATATAANLMQDGMGAMSAMDCLLLGMMCVFGAFALALLLALSARLQTQLRRRLVARALAGGVRLTPPEPPSLIVLSISRT